MANLILEHVKGGDLPPDWAKKLDTPPNVTFTVAIVEETGSLSGKAGEQDSGTLPEDFPLFGVWKDNTATDDVGGYVRSLRKNRF
ncbi:MAG: hypothetical protein HQK86_08090 [Nitrospinae bacterium]|nr:hypothetical protein [Nitrospinota bacterium]MBF0635091.1 hypothetical protein [Nitrospinota bacterium]